MNNPPHLHVRNVSFSSSTKATVNVNGFWYVSTQWQVVTRLNLVLHTPVCPPLKLEDVPPSLNSIPNAYSEAHFLPMLPHATRRDDVAGNKQVYGGVRTCTRNAGSASGSASLLRVHGHPDKFHCLT